jgi:hypothetical protein
MVCVATGPDSARTAWACLPEDIAVVLLTPAAAEALGSAQFGDRLTVVMPR